MADDYSTPRVHRHRRHIEGDHSECLDCPVRVKLEVDCREFIIASLAIGISDDTIKQMAGAKFPDWLVDYLWETLPVMRLESHYVS